jgi:maleate cis-trans isomerase
MIDLRPAHQLGYLLPVMVGDAIYYQFHRVAPPDTLLVAYPIGLTRFTGEAVDAALDHFWAGVDFLAGRGVERIVQGGIPVSAFAGRQRILRLIGEAEQRTGIPVTADFEESIEALRSLGVQRVAVAAKWDDTLMAAVSRYLTEAGLEVVGTTSEPHTAQQVLAIASQDGIDLALRLGREAFRRTPSAEGLLLAGGAWLSLQAIPQLEAEFDRPVVSNPSATFWAALRQFGVRSPHEGWGRLLDGLPQAASAAPLGRGVRP